MKFSKKLNIASGIFLFIILMTCLVFVTYSTLEKSVKNIVIENVNEIAEHDMRNIKTYISNKLDTVRSVIEELKYEETENIEDVQEKIYIKTITGFFTKFFLIDENGNLYSNDFSIYSPQDNDFRNYFNGENGKLFARRYDKNTKFLENQKEYLLYGYDFSDKPFTVGDVNFVSAIALNDISIIRSKIHISGFGGKSFSSVINRDGYYIVNKSESDSEEPETFFNMITDSNIEGSLTKLEILEKIRGHEEEIEFSFTTNSGIPEYMIIKPIENTNWCFISSIEISVFNEQTHSFMYITMGAIFTLILLIVAFFIIFWITTKKLRKVYETNISGVYNRLYYDEKLKGLYIQGFIMFDLDHLKYINDGFGHLAGDQSIASAAFSIKKYVKDSGYVVKYGGDEFCAVFKEKLSEEDFKKIVNDILDEIWAVRLEKFPDVRLSLSIGGYYGDGMAGDLFCLADELLYEAKKSRDCAVTNID